MRFISYGPAGQERAAVIANGGYVDLEYCMQAVGLGEPSSSVLRFLHREDWRYLLPAIQDALPRQMPIEPSKVRLGAPIPRPGQILLAGLNYRSHRKEVTDESTPKRPVVLGKAANSVIGPYDTVIRPPEINKLDYEGEVAIVIGRKARRIPPERVSDYIAGYTLMNDISGRDLQLAEFETNPFFRVHFLGKSADTFAPMGPCLVTADELDLSCPMHIRTWVDEELRQNGDTASLIFSIEEFVSYVSSVATLYPGDVISTGTPGGVGHYMKPPQYLRDGQVVRIQVPGIGEIRNPVRDEVLAEVQPT